MNLFDQLVTEALKTQPKLSSLRVVVEKELLHHDILRILSHNNLLADLTFIGGTALRTCYGGARLSEDLDFTGGHNFNKASLSKMAHILIENLNDKYGLPVNVSEPVKDSTNVDTWKINLFHVCFRNHAFFTPFEMQTSVKISTAKPLISGAAFSSDEVTC